MPRAHDPDCKLCAIEKGMPAHDWPMAFLTLAVLAERDGVEWTDAFDLCRHHATLSITIIPKIHVLTQKMSGIHDDAATRAVARQCAEGEIIIQDSFDREDSEDGG